MTEPSADALRRVGDIHMPDPEIEWRAHHAMWIGVTSIVIAAALGLCGDGLISKRTVVMQDGTVATFSRVLRLTNDFDVLLTSVPTVAKRCQVQLADASPDWFDIVKVVPRQSLADNSASSAPQTISDDGSTTCTIRLTLRARAFGRHFVNLRDARGDVTQLAFMVLP